LRIDIGETGSLDGRSDLAMDWEGAIELLGEGWDPGNDHWNTRRCRAT
jgi:hypothetical protein